MGFMKIHRSNQFRCLSFGPLLNKVLEFQVSKWEHGTPKVLNLDIWYVTKLDDHAGITIDLEVFGIEFSLAFYDTRHADMR